jgi:hypothetical protein
MPGGVLEIACSLSRRFVPLSTTIYRLVAGAFISNVDLHIIFLLVTLPDSLLYTLIHHAG